MKVSFNWLKELVALPAGTTADEVARRLTLGGLEVESIDRRGRDVGGVRVAEVRGVRPHPGAEKLRIVRVSTGATDAEEDVVCGAPNVPGPGGRVAWAPPGATLPGGVTLGRKEIRGVLSPGMICSEKELGIGEGVDGILILSTEVPVGADLATALGIADDVFEVNVTPNRADALSHAGIAREVAALFATTWQLPPLPAAPTAAPHRGTAANASEASSRRSSANASEATASAPAISLEVRDEAACPRYQATILRGLAVAPSPLSMRLRLSACGVRPISNLVDVTNYAMLEIGQPLHAFDLDKLRGGIIVRRALAGEQLQTLDGVARELMPDEIVIADEEGPVALAGVMGGARTEVSATTTNVLLESASFDPRGVRRAAKRLSLHSEASHRFERGVDVAGVAVAGARAAALMAELGGGAIAGAPVERAAAAVPARHVRLGFDTLGRVAGFTIAGDVAAEKLRSIEIPVALEADALVATVPSFRPDITIEEDLIEEVMRLVGYDQAPSRLPAGGKAPAPSPERGADRARDVLAARGLHEIVSWAFVPRGALAALGDPVLAAGIAVKNPISADYEIMRTSLLPGLADAARRNRSRGIVDVRLFEVGPVVHPIAGDAHNRQVDVAAGLLMGRRDGWMKPGDALDFFDLKHVVSALAGAFGIDDPRFDPPAVVPSFLHPGVAARLSVGVAATGERAVLGVAGELHPLIARRLGLDAPAFYFEVELDALAARAARFRAIAPPRFPSVARDVSFWIDAAISADAQLAAMRGSGEPLLREIAALEDFRDPRFVPAGKKGMLWTLTYRSADRTLTDAEVDAAHARVIAALAKAREIQIR